MKIKVRYSHTKNTTENWLLRMKQKRIEKLLNKYGQEGVALLKTATPVKTGTTANSWTYSVLQTQNGFELIWSNTNVNKGINIAILLQYDHGTRNGGFVKGIDYINPAIRPVFDELSKKIREEVILS